MKILLVAVNAKYIHTNPAVYCLRSAAGVFRDQITIKEFTINQPVDEILREIWEEKPELIGFSCYIWNIEIIERLLVELKKLLPDCNLWLGGPEAEARAEELLQRFPLTGIMYGEGEAVFRKVLENNGEPSAGIDGIYYKKQITTEATRICKTKAQEPLPFSELPFPYDTELLKTLQGKIIYYESSRGCPFRCSYCLSSNDTRVRFRSIEQVKKDFALFFAERIPQVKLVDRTFNCNHERTEELLSFYLQNDNGITNIHFEIAGDLLTDKELSLLEQFRPGALQLEIGVQTTNTEVLRRIGRSCNLERLFSNVRRLKQAGNIHLHLDLIAGLPGETLESFRASFDKVYDLQPDQLQLGFLKVLGTTRMEREAEQYGIVYRSYPPYEVLYTKAISYKELQTLKHVEEMTELYYNSGQFALELAFLSHWFSSPFAMFLELAAVYYESCPEGKTSRIGKYDILLLFRTKKLPETEAEAFRQLAVYDCYARERMKARPAFAGEARKWNKSETEGVSYKKENHLEYFTIDTVKTAQSGHRVKQECIAVFDYEKRSEITNNAGVTIYPING